MASRRRGAGGVPAERNLSTRQFRSPTLATDLDGILRRTGLDSGHLTLEVTESAAITDATVAIATLGDLRALGVHLTIDDFGTGYAALSSLKRFPVDGLKIDRSFVTGLGRRQDDTAIVAAIIGVARALDLGVTAEGIETAEQVRRLRELGCSCGQGFFFGRPMTADELEAALLRQPWRAADEPIWLAAAAVNGARA